MDSIHYIIEDTATLPSDEIGMIEDGHKPNRLDDADGKKQVEYRNHKRFQLEKDAFALIRSGPSGPLEINGKSMGCIACAVYNANPAKLGKIDNISMGGLTFHYAHSKAYLSRALVLDILLADCGFYLANILFKIIADVLIPDEVFTDAIEIRQVRLQFQQLSTIQQASLKDLIVSHGTEI